MYDDDTELHFWLGVVGFIMIFIYLVKWLIGQ